MYQAETEVGDEFNCSMKLQNNHSKYAIKVENQQNQIVGHVPDRLARIITPEWRSGVVLSMKAVVPVRHVMLQKEYGFVVEELKFHVDTNCTV